MIRVAVVASALAVRTGLRALLSESEDIEVVAEAASLGEAVPLPPDTNVLVLVTDNFSNSEDAARLQEDEAVPVLLLVSDEVNADSLVSRLPLHAGGVLPLETSLEELLAAVSAITEGLFVSQPALLEPLLKRYTRMIANESVVIGADAGEELVEPLTERETQVLALLAQGMPNKQVALSLGISEHTVKFHVSAIYAKLGVTNRTEAVRMGVRYGLVVL